MEKRKINSDKLVVIGGSSGSLDVLLHLLPGLKGDIDYPIVIVLHRKSSSDSILSDLLSTRTTLKVKEIEEKEMLTAGVIYIAPGDYHVLFEKDHTFSLDYSEKINYSRPSIDASFESAADIFGGALTCILLSGANADGSEGFRHAKSKNATLIAQLPSTADVPYMPEQAINNAPVDHIFNVAQMISFLNQL